MRDKPADYGVDLEVEIFSSSGLSTGFIFFVQLRATEQARSARSIRLNRDQLEYFRSLDIPTLVVRYGASPEIAFQRWHVGFDRPIKASKTYHFTDSEKWSQDTPTFLEASMRTWRLLRTHGDTASIAFEVHQGAIDSERYQGAAQVVRRTLKDVPGFRRSKETDEGLRLVVTLNASSLEMSWPPLPPLSLDMDVPTSDTLQAATLYCATIFLALSRLATHAELAAKRCLRLGVACPNPSLSLSACFAFGSDVVGACDLALLNELQSDLMAASLFSAHLLAVPSDQSERAEAHERFARAAVEANPTQANFHYGLANLLASSHRYSEAIRRFNQARKIEPAYLTRPYFVLEVAAALFSAHRYAAAARWYGFTPAASRSPLLSLRLGDALFLSGRCAEALEAFGAATAADDRNVAVEASLKEWVSSVIVELLGPVLSVRTTLADQLISAGSELAVVLQADQLHPLANFNSGVVSAQRGMHLDALVHFLICAIRNSYDAEVWSNAISCAMNNRDYGLGALVTQCAVTMGGPDVVVGFRDQLSKLMPDTLASFDEIIADILEGIQRLPTTLRWYGADDGYIEQIID